MLTSVSVTKHSARPLRVAQLKTHSLRVINNVKIEQKKTAPLRVGNTLGRQEADLNLWLHVSIMIWVIWAKASVYLLLQQQHGFYCYSSPTCMQVESQCYSLVAAPLMFHGTWHISGLQELALRHFLSCLLLQFRFWDRVSLYCCCRREPGESVAGFWNETDRTSKAIYKKQADNCWKG